MKRMDRRQFLRLGGTTAAGAFLAACGGTTGQAPAAPSAAPASTIAGASPSAAASVAASTAASTAASGPVTIRWWDHFSPLKPLHDEIFAAYQQQHPNVTIQHEIYNLPELGQSLQLAFNSQQAPDVHAIASLNVPSSRLVADGWFVPLDDYVSDDFRSRFPEGLLLEGLHTFNGKLYSFPLFGFRSHASLLWFNKELLEQAGLDPETGPRTWDEFRQAAKTVTEAGNGQFAGWIQAIQLADRLGVQAGDLAQTAGLPGAIDWRTGEYVFHTDPMVEAVEFMLALQSDGSLFPGSTSLDARNARARFAAGGAAFNLDGPWSIGVMNNEYTDFLDKVSVAQVPVPNADQPSYVHRGPIGGDFWVSSQSQHPEIGAALLEQFNTDEYYVKLAERMDQPPLDLTAVERADVHPAYKQALQYFGDIVRLDPSPLVKNPDTAQVMAQMTDIRPNLGEIVQGALSGDISDYRAALKEYSDKMTAERDRAIQAARDGGAEVSIDDWIFSNWDPTEDYTAEMYG
jgi:multiple sugar transport system substrate-binding protein